MQEPQRPHNASVTKSKLINENEGLLIFANTLVATNMSYDNSVINNQCLFWSNFHFSENSLLCKAVLRLRYSGRKKFSDRVRGLTSWNFSFVVQNMYICNLYVCACLMQQHLWKHNIIFYTNLSWKYLRLCKKFKGVQILFSTTALLLLATFLNKFWPAPF